MICNKLRECINGKQDECKECVEFTDKREKVKCEERSKKYTLINTGNRKEIRKYNLDGGIVKNEIGFKACDNLLIVYDTETVKAIFVELKGSDYKHAVEQLNKTGLKNHGLDSNGQLYKINYFEFYRNEDVIKLQSDPTYDSTAFEELLETKGNTDNS